MTSLYKRILFHVRPDLRMREVHRVLPHPVLGDLHFHGGYSTHTGALHGGWEVTPPGFERHIAVSFPARDPTPDDLARLVLLLGDLDALFERVRSAITSEYEQFVEQPMPADWRTAFRLEALTLPDPEHPAEPWEIMYWCEDAMHSFVIELVGESVTYVDVAG